MCKRILLVSVNDRSYQSYRFFAGQLSKALQEAGCEIGWCRFEAADSVKDTAGGNADSTDRADKANMEAWGKALMEAQAFRADAVVDFNSFLPGMKAGGHTLPELFDAPFYNYILDHPLYHHKALAADLPGSHCICLDEKHARYIRNAYPSVGHILCSPIPGSLGTNGDKPFAERKNRILFCGTYETPERYLELIKTLPARQSRQMLQMAERMLANPGIQPEEALLQTEAVQTAEDLSASDAAQSGSQFPERVRETFLVEAYVRHMRRREILLTLYRAGVPLDLHGNGWENFLAEVRKESSLPGVQSDSDHPSGVRIYPTVPYKDYVNLVGEYRLALNIMPGFWEGSHDRITCAMRNRTAVITDRNAYIDSHYLPTAAVSERCVEAFDLTDVKGLPELCFTLLSDIGRAEQVADNGFSYAGTYHTWEAFARSLLEDIEASK